MQPEELSAWLRLLLTSGVGNQTARRLLSEFGLPTAVFGQSSLALSRCVGPAHAAALRSTPATLAPLLERTLDWLTRRNDPAAAPRAILSLGDPGYPAALLAIEDPPLLLYLTGRDADAPQWETARALAIVGSRNPTPQGASNARAFASFLSSAGLTVVSGLALGIDGAAHEGALAAATGHDRDDNAQPHRCATIAVVGTGLDRVYPKRHLALAHRIAEHGLIVSEYPPGTPALAANFPRRNRLIAGLSQGVLVVEAALQSGSLITARLASEQGKEVFAIPGSIHSPQSRGCHWLIRQGAKLVETGQDVLEELRLPAAATAAPVPDAVARPEAHPLLEALGFDPVGLDMLVARTGIDAARLQVQLLELELEGWVGRLPGGQFQRIGSA